MAAQVAATAGGITSTIATLFPAAAAAGPIGLAVAAGAEIVGLILSFVGGGCGQACIQSAQLEQVYEVAGDLVLHAASMGMITPAAAVTGLQAILQAGTQSMQSLEAKDSQAAKGLENMTKTINALISSAQGLAAATPVAYDFSALQSSWLAMTTPSGWYAQSLTAGEQLAEQMLPSLVPSSTASIAAAAGGVVSGAIGGSWIDILLLVGAGILGIKLLGAIF